MQAVKSQPPLKNAWVCDCDCDCDEVQKSERVGEGVRVRGAGGGMHMHVSNFAALAAHTTHWLSSFLAPQLSISHPTPHLTTC